MESLNVQTVKKRKRAANWDDMEKSLLKECLRGHLDIIENKCTDTNTNKSKNVAWQKVSDSFNEMNNKNRHLTEIKQQWRMMKIGAKKCSSDYKRALKATGGGHKPPSPDPQTADIINMIPQEFEEDVNKYDSDYIMQGENQEDVTFIRQEEDIHEIGNEHTPKSKGKNVIENNKEIIILTKENDVNKKDASCHSGRQGEDLIQRNIISEDKEMCQEMLTPINKVKSFKKIDEKNSQKKKYKKVEIIQSSVVSKERNEVVMKLLKEEHSVKMTQMHESHEWAREEHELRVRKLKCEIKLLEDQLSKNKT